MFSRITVIIVLATSAVLVAAAPTAVNHTPTVTVRVCCFTIFELNFEGLTSIRFRTFPTLTRPHSPRPNRQTRFLACSVR